METLDSQPPSSVNPSPEAVAKQGQDGPTDEQIAFHANLIYENEGRQAGHDKEYWERAERELRESIKMKKIQAGCVDAVGNPACKS